MAPKEKAQELIDKYSIKVEVFFTEDSIIRIVNASMRLNSAKQCALIAVDEMLTWFKAHSYSNKNYDAFVFYNEVKQEIEAL
jgi:hypothetical protein